MVSFLVEPPCTTTTLDDLGMNDHMGGIKGDILKNQFKLTGPDQAIDRS